MRRPARAATRRRPGLRGWALAAALLATLPPPGQAAAQGTVVAQRAALEAAFLRNFARYVEWPSATFVDERAPWVVCVLGAEHLDGTLEKTFGGRTEHGRSFDVVRAASAEQLRRCQIVFVGMQNPAQRRAVLAELKRLPVLTVGNAPEFLDEGGIVRLQAGEHIEMGINLDQARAASLTIPSKMLEVARTVVENGVVRKWR